MFIYMPMSTPGGYAQQQSWLFKPVLNIKWDTDRANNTQQVTMKVWDALASGKGPTVSSYYVD